LIKEYKDKGTRSRLDNLPGFLCQRQTLLRACFMFIIHDAQPSFKERKGVLLLTQERHEYLKAIIQESLWKAFRQTGESIYQEMYNKWYEKFDGINIANIE